MALNLRTISPDLHKRLKLAAFSSGKALERFCLDALEESITPKQFKAAPPAIKHHPNCKCSICAVGR